MMRNTKPTCRYPVTPTDFFRWRSSESLNPVRVGVNDLMIRLYTYTHKYTHTRTSHTHTHTHTRTSHTRTHIHNTNTLHLLCTTLGAYSDNGIWTSPVKLSEVKHHTHTLRQQTHTHTDSKHTHTHTHSLLPKKSSLPTISSSHNSMIRKS